jgi:hypothetical protein
MEGVKIWHFRSLSAGILIIAGLLLSSASISNANAAQRGQAPPGCYPLNYFGTTWSGEITAADDQARTITLTVTKGSKTQTFTGKLSDGFSVKYTDGTVKDLQPSDIPPNAAAMAYYIDFTEKVDGKKATVHEIFMLDVKTPDGREQTFKTHFEPRYREFSGQGSPVSTGMLDPCAVQKQ